MLYAISAVIVAWYGLRLVSHWWGPARPLEYRLSRYTRRLHAWVISAPATFAYVAVFTASTLLQETAPPRLISLLVTLQSTNLERLRIAPLSVLADSALWVANRGAGLAFYVLVFVTVVAWAERRYGTPRMIVICASGHVFGSLLTAVVETHAIESGLAPYRLAVSTDVGVSYIMVAGCAATLVLMRGPWRLFAALALGGGTVIPALINHTLWDLGHLFALLCGLVTASLLLLIAEPRMPPDLDVFLADRDEPGWQTEEDMQDEGNIEDENPDRVRSVIQDAQPMTMTQRDAVSAWSDLPDAHRPTARDSADPPRGKGIPRR